MTLSLTRKLTLAFLLTAMIAAGLVAVFVRLSGPERFNDLIVAQNRSELEQVLVRYYEVNGSWRGVDRHLRLIGFLPPPQGGMNGQNPPVGQALPAGQGFPAEQGLPPLPFDARRVFGLADEQGMVVLGLANLPVGSRASTQVLAQGQPLEIDGRIVGTILTPPDRPQLTREEQAYLQRTNQALLLAALGGVLAALVVGLLLARTLTQPLRALTQAAQRMAGGDWQQEVQVAAQDEIGELARAFNQMSQEVAQANQRRRQMTADIAHDLRTPLTVIAGYIESMQDGVLEATPERLEVIYSEIERLQGMVTDLRTLSQADAKELPLYRQTCQVQTLLSQTADLYAQRAGQQGVKMMVQAAGSLPEVQVDVARLAQVLGNLIENALRYTPEGGMITLGAKQEDETLLIEVSDTGVGIAADDLPRLFDRFYRADPARQDDGGSGLGLAIARGIMEAHGGKIWAESDGHDPVHCPGSRFYLRLSL